jgi:ketosteroid isomerase-like protein
MTDQIPGHRAATDTQDEQDLKILERQWADALVQRDTVALDKLQVEDFIFTNPFAYVSNKQQYIDDVKGGDLAFTSLDIDDLEVRIHSNAAVLTARLTDRGTYKGQDIAGQYRITQVYVKDQGRWRMAAGHGTHIPKS